jgi:hypothetical protein
MGDVTQDQLCLYGWEGRGGGAVTIFTSSQCEFVRTYFYTNYFFCLRRLRTSAEREPVPYKKKKTPRHIIDNAKII